MAMTKSDLASEVARYAATFHDAIGYRHHVASPLGAWLLLALCAPAAAGSDASGLAEVLGTDGADAAARAADLLAAPHPLVAAAAAVWSQPGAAKQQWLEGLPPVVTQGEVPAKPDLDQWARDHTFGLIEEFPVPDSAMIDLLIATALATKVSWAHPFDLAPASSLGSTPWAGQLRQVLRSPNDPTHTVFITPAGPAGDVAVHAARAQGGLLVASVIAEADVPPAQVMAQAHDIATAMATNQAVPQKSLFQLPIGTAPLWTIREERSGSAGERFVAMLPAWSAQSRHDLKDPRFGFAAAAAALGSGSGDWDAVQAAMARYSRTGFEAAAVTAMYRLTAAMPRMGISRTAELRFGHPYAVVAVTADPVRDGAVHTPWHGVPVFSAWVAEPSEA
jgi:hypothetical protein